MQRLMAAASEQEKEAGRKGTPPKAQAAENGGAAAPTFMERDLLRRATWKPERYLSGTLRIYPSDLR